MQSTSSRHQRSSSEVEEVLQARSRRTAAGNLGRKHFHLAAGLIQPQHQAKDDEQHHSASSPSTSYFAANPQTQYGDAWQQWMTQGLRSAAVSYDEAWHRWMGSQHQKDSQTALASQTIFEDVPREATRPIMSRLPIDALESHHDEVAANPTRAGNLEYLTTKDLKSTAPAGVHHDHSTSQEVTYTRARLPDVDEESLHLWQALHWLRNKSDDYADGYEAPSSSRGKRADAATSTSAVPHPIADDMDVTQCPAFNPTSSSASDRALALVKRLFDWDALPDLPEEDEYVWYGVAFRSKRKENSESVNLYEADRLSHEEAVQSGGLLMYWYGSPNAQTGHNLATCIWQNRQEAIRASSLPLHARAAAHALKAYESFELNRYALRKVKGEKRLQLEEWQE